MQDNSFCRDKKEKEQALTNKVRMQLQYLNQPASQPPRQPPKKFAKQPPKKFARQPP